MKKSLILFTALAVFSFSVSAEISNDLQNQLDELDSQDRVEVLLQTGPSMTDQHVEVIREQGELKNRYDLFDGVHLELPVPAVHALADRDFVESIEPNYDMELFLSESSEQVEVNPVWEYGVTGEGIQTAVLDTGIHSPHSALNVEEQVDFTGEGLGDSNGHGTHVAGIIGSQDENNRGLAYNSDLHDVKVLNQDGRGHGSDLLEGMEWTVENNIQIAVMSLGATVEDCDGEDILSQAVDKMTDQGVFVAVAAGNEGPEDETITIPGCSRDGTTVGAVDKNDGLADYSGRGSTADGRTKPDVVAPGTNIESTWNDGGFNTNSGTSMATPHVAGQAALLLEEDSSQNPGEIKQVIIDSATDLGLEPNEQGAGRINVSESYFQISDEDRGEMEEDEEQEDETEEDETEEEQDDETEETESEQEAQPEERSEGEARVRFGPDSMFYGLRIASDRAAVSLGVRTRQDVMDRRANEARIMQERGNPGAAERAVRELRKSAGSSENATREAENTLERVMNNTPEDAKEGLRNALRNVEERQRRSPEDQTEERLDDRVPESPEQRQDESSPDRDTQQRIDPRQEERREEREEEREDLEERTETQQEREELEERAEHRGAEGLEEQKQNTSEQLQEQERPQQETNQERHTPQNRSQTQERNNTDGVGQFFRDRLNILE